MNRQGRILAVLFLMGLGFALVAVRLVYLQVFQRAELSLRAERQQEHLVKLEPKRGTIYDRMGRELAVSLDVDSVYGVPAEVVSRMERYQDVSFTGLRAFLTEMEGVVPPAEQEAVLPVLLQDALPLPVRLMDDPQGKVWFMPDWRFRQPRALSAFKTEWFGDDRNG